MLQPLYFNHFVQMLYVLPNSDNTGNFKLKHAIWSYTQTVTLGGYLLSSNSYICLDLFSQVNACGSNLVASRKSLHFKWSLTGGLNVLKTTYWHIIFITVSVTAALRSQRYVVKA